MTINQINKTVQALIETKAMLKKELAYKKELQNIKEVDFLNQHISKLENMLIDSYVQVQS